MAKIKILFHDWMRSLNYENGYKFCSIFKFSFVVMILFQLLYYIVSGEVDLKLVSF